ncbi:SgcJ/EcaC family oxidoreductase [Amycolatopsis rhabdoformis]|uniref:SgcJ/EcaC family oxidoreductase n=1 Tax=Amycolatopsis rhabdoformis TaxID=1448059 RepID=A0ABZ1I0H0_9PSEU|nr:SgcJ/EcaC family oxidoreductase [Amycolatopsis rhabdoformis]WSE27869.1 SgcJ/EcaC family oxidoreductase [Amycolatopsis rhabdoformis]
MSENEIRDLLTERTDAMRAKDPERLVAGYAEDAVKFDLAPPLRTTGASAEFLTKWFGTFDSPVTYEYTDVEVTESGDLAFTTALAKMSAVPAGMSEPFTLWFRSTLVFRRVDGAWRIVHEHSSTPFHMDGSFRAAIDLRP